MEVDQKELVFGLQEEGNQQKIQNLITFGI